MAQAVEGMTPPDEAERLAAVRRYRVLDTPPDGAFDRITRLASQVLGMPIAIVTIVDHDRIWFKSAEGLHGIEQIDRDPGLCASAILGHEAWVIEDASVDPRALANPLDQALTASKRILADLAEDAPTFRRLEAPG